MFHGKNVEAGTMLLATKTMNTLCVGLLLLAIALIPAPSTLHAQSKVTADKTMDVSVFGGLQHLDPDYGRAGYGFTAGGDLTRYIGWRVAPSLEVRGNYATARSVSESTILFGLRVKTDFRRRFHPYVDFLVGPGRINFDQPLAPGYSQDSSVVYSYGAGADLDVYRNFAAKIDFQGQSWNLGPNTSLPVSQQTPFTLAPTTWVFGISYRIPFRSNVRQQ